MLYAKNSHNLLFVQVFFPHVINHPAEIVQSWLECFASSSIFTGLGAFWLPFVSIAVEFFEGENFRWRKDSKNAHGEVFSDKSQTFYERGIMKLVGRWQKVTNNNGWDTIHENIRGM